MLLFVGEATVKPRSWKLESNQTLPKKLPLRNSTKYKKVVLESSFQPNVRKKKKN